MTYAEMQSRFAFLFDNRPIDTTDRDALINEGYKIFASLTQCIKGVGTMASVADKPEYDVPSFIDKIDNVYFRGKLLDAFPEHNLYQLYSTSDRNDLPSDTLYFYRKEYDDHVAGASRSRRMIGLIGVQDDAADATALNDATGVDADDETFTVDSTENFPDFGDFICGTEVIHYLYKDGTNLYGCIRGQEGTTAATHADNAVITLRDIVIYGSKIPASMSSSSDLPTSIDVAYHNYIVEYAVGVAMSRIEKNEEYSKHMTSFYNGIKLYDDAMARKIQMQGSVPPSWQDWYNSQQS